MKKKIIICMLMLFVVCGVFAQETLSVGEVVDTVFYKDQAGKTALIEGKSYVSEISYDSSNDLGKLVLIYCSSYITIPYTIYIKPSMLGDENACKLSFTNNKAVRKIGVVTKIGQNYIVFQKPQPATE